MEERRITYDRLAPLWSPPRQPTPRKSVKTAFKAVRHVGRFLIFHSAAFFAAIVGFIAAAFFVLNIDGIYPHSIWRISAILGFTFSGDYWYFPYVLSIAAVIVVRCWSRCWHVDQRKKGIGCADIAAFGLTLVFVFAIRIHWFWL